MDWHPIETIPDDGTPKLIAYSGGSVCISPGIGGPLSKAEALKLIKAGHWPSHREFTPTFWMRVPKAPEWAPATGSAANGNTGSPTEPVP